jgi:hypothetical protein
LVQVFRRINAAAEIPGDVLEVGPAKVVSANLHLPRLSMGAPRVWENHRAH